MSHAPSRTDQLAGVLTTPVTLAQRLLPASPTPVALATSALALAGLVEWPVAAALGLGYLALRGRRAPHRNTTKPPPNPSAPRTGAAPTTGR